MPVRRCRENGKPGYKCGNEGKCYTYTSGDEAGRKRAKEKAVKQCIAMGEPPGEAAKETFETHLNESDCDGC